MQVLILISSLWMHKSMHCYSVRTLKSWEWASVAQGTIAGWEPEDLSGTEPDTIPFKSISFSSFINQNSEILFASSWDLLPVKRHIKYED